MSFQTLAIENWGQNYFLRRILHFSKSWHFLIVIGPYSILWITMGKRQLSEKCKIHLKKIFGPSYTKSVLLACKWGYNWLDDFLCKKSKREIYYRSFYCIQKLSHMKSNPDKKNHWTLSNLVMDRIRLEIFLNWPPNRNHRKK